MTGWDRLAEEFASQMVACLHKEFDQIQGTPIERLFLGGMMAVAIHANALFGGISINIREDSHEGAAIKGREVWVWPQYKVLDWKVDFLIGMADDEGRNHFAVVECDGHDFHERTKEQAAKDRSRDRRLQDAGFPILRFTGSEIYRNPMGSASEAMAVLLKKVSA